MEKIHEEVASKENTKRYLQLLEEYERSKRLAEELEVDFDDDGILYWLKKVSQPEYLAGDDRYSTDLMMFCKLLHEKMKILH